MKSRWVLALLVPSQRCRPPSSACTRRPNSWKKVAKLVEEGDHILVRHQPGISGLAPRQITDESGLGQIAMRRADPNEEMRSMLVFALARMHVEVEPPDQAPPFEHFPPLDRAVPDRWIDHTTECDTEEPARNVEHSLLHLVIREIGADELRIEVVIRPSHQLFVVRRFPSHHRSGRGVILLFPA